MKGTLLVSLRESGMGIDDNELRRLFNQFGDVKIIRPNGRHDQRLVEMFDTRVGLPLISEPIDVPGYNLTKHLCTIGY